jgi:hypothetical protein
MYRVLSKAVLAEADQKSANRQVECRRCGAPFHGREGSLALKILPCGSSVNTCRQHTALANRPRLTLPANAEMLGIYESAWNNLSSNEQNLRARRKTPLAQTEKKA